MPRIDPEEFERRAQRLRKAGQEQTEALEAQRGAEERLSSARKEWHAAYDAFREYTETAAGLDPDRNKRTVTGSPPAA